MAEPTPTTSLTRSERLDRLPFTTRHRTLLLGSGIGWALDAMDVGLISFVIAALGEHWGLTTTQRSWVVSVGFVGMALGASVGGLIASILAPLAVPGLLGLGGQPLTFGVFAVAFVLAAGAALALPELRGRALPE